MPVRFADEDPQAVAQTYLSWLYKKHAHYPLAKEECPEAFRAAVYCEKCQFWLNGPAAMANHLRGPKHSKKMDKLEDGSKTS